MPPRPPLDPPMVELTNLNQAASSQVMASILLFFLPNLCPSFNINTAIIRKSDIADEPTSSADVLGGNVLLKIPVGGGRTHSGVPKRYPRCPSVSIGGPVGPQNVTFLKT